MAESKIVVQVILDNKALQTGSAQTKRVLDDVSKSTSNLQKSVSKTNKALQQNRAQSGLNNAILIELGRTASDAQYGFQGMANNIGRLVELGQEFARTGGGGIRGALGTLGKSILGTGGILIGIQLLISFLPTLQKKFKEMTSDSDDLNDATKDLTKSYDELTKSITENNKAQAEQDEAVVDILDKVFKLSERLEKNKKKYGDSAEEIKRFNSNNATTLFLLDKRIRQAEELGIKIDYLRLNEEGYRKELEKQVGTAGTLAASIEEMKTQLKIDKILGELSPVEIAQKEIDIFIATQKALAVEEQVYLNSSEYRELVAKRVAAENDARIKAIKKDEKRVKKNVDELKKLYKQFLEELTAARKEAEKEIIGFQENQDNIALAAAKKVYAERLLGLTMALKSEKKTEEEFAAGKVELDKFLIQAEIEALQERLFNEKLTANERFKIEEELYNKRRQLLNLGTEEQKKTFVESLEYYNQLSQQLFSAVGSIYDAEIQREERKTTLLNNQLQERLNNEKLTAEQREAINNQIEANEIKLAKNRDKLAEKQFKMNKAASIANALVSTYSAGAQVLKDTPGGSFARIAAMILVISTGLAQVAAIARQQFVPSALPSGSAGGAGGAGGGGMKAPDFNVVGASGQSQLAQTIAGSEAQPVRAYVVGKDITTQQELDRNITNTASLG